MRKLHPDEMPVLAEVAAFRAWMKFLFFPDGDKTAALATVRAALRDGNPDSDPAKSVRNLRLLSNCAVVLRQSGLGEEFLGLMDSLEDRRLNAAWAGDSRVEFIGRNAVWRHSRPLTEPAAAWHSDPAFDDSAWPRGPAPIGFGNALVFRSTVDVDKSEPAARPVLFRRVFDCPDPAAFDALKLRLRAVDGAIVRLNGTEILRRGVTAGAAWPAPAEKSLEVTAAPIPKAELLPDALQFLRPGRNILTVQLHLGAERAKLFRACLDIVLEGHKKTP